MNNVQCPGSIKLREPIPEFFKCPKCGAEVEIWTHEQSRKCEKCGNEVYKEQVPTCVEWCKYAIDCIGKEAYERYMKGKKTDNDPNSDVVDNKE